MTVLDELNFSRKPKLPIILAAEGAECGIACLAMIAKYYGHAVDLGGLRQRFPVSLTGATLQNLMTLCDRLNLSTRALRAELDALPNLRLPAVVHWDLNHFVVLASVSRRAAVIHDPAQGRRQLSLDEFSKHYTGITLEISPSVHFEPIEARTPIGLTSLWSRSSGMSMAVTQLFGLSLALQVAAFIAPFNVQLITDQVLTRGDTDLLAVLAIGFGALFVIQAGLDALRSWTLQVLGATMAFQVVGNIIRHLLKLPATFFERRHVGDILSRIGSASAIRDALTRGVIAAILDGATALAAAALLFAYSSLLAVIVILGVCLNLAIALALYPVMRRRTQEQLVANAKEQSHVMETVRAASVIKLMGREVVRESAWRNLYADVINTSIYTSKIQISIGFFQAVFSSAQTVAVVYLGALSVINGNGFSVGMLLAFLSFRQTFTDRTSSLINQGMQFRLLNLHLERLADIVASAPEVPAEAVMSQFAIKGSISVHNLCCRYGSTDPLVLEDVDLEIPPGEFFAITGPSGGGKTTLLKVLLGLVPATSGEIVLDGQKATPEIWKVWRQGVGVVAQDDRLLSGSIADNISFFDPDVDMDKVIEAAERAQIHADVARKPMQYQSLIGDMGSTLSAGQRQRILLARALYRNPSILFLDEGTANLDEYTEELIADLIEGLSITRIVVAHRPALLHRAHRVATVNEAKLEFPRGPRRVVAGAI